MQTRKKSGDRPTERRILIAAFAGIDEMLNKLREEAKLTFHWFPAPNGQVEIHTKELRDYDRFCLILKVSQTSFVTRRTYRNPNKERFA